MTLAMGIVFLVLLTLTAVPTAGELVGLTCLDWSKDGRYILYVAGGEVWVGWAPEGRKPWRVSGGPGTDWARFGPGDWLVYATLEPEGYVLWRSDLEGRREPLLSQRTSILRPTVSPDGSKVAFVGDRDGQVDLYLLDLDSREVRRLTFTPGPEDTPDFSPDGRFLAFVGLWEIGSAPASWEVFVLDLQDGGVEQVTEDGHFDWAPRFSPDGEWMAFESTSRGSSDIHLIRRDGSERVAFTLDRWRDAFPCWCPLGDRIAYGSLRSGGWVILVDRIS